VKTTDGVRKVANYQRAIIFCLLANIGFWITSISLQGQANPALTTILMIVFFAVGLAQLVFIVLLATEVYNVAIGVVLGLFSFFPCLGLLILLMVNQKSTKTLQANGVRVGFLGADLSQFNR
jgi:hypothetical protein